LQDFDERMARFEREMQKYGVARIEAMPPTHQFICARYGQCN